MISNEELPVVQEDDKEVEQLLNLKLLSAVAKLLNIWTITLNLVW